MASPRVCVLRAPGTNCDIETAFAFEHCGARADRPHLFQLLENPRRLLDYQILCVPGGFSYGDDIGAGTIFGAQLRGHITEVLGEFLQGDTLVLGICNGFQVLLKAGILPGGVQSWPPESDHCPEATLTWNDNGKYTAAWVHLEVATPNNVFLQGIDRIELPIAHAEGKFAVRDESMIETWRKNGQVAVCYAGDPKHEPASTTDSGVLPSPYNPNGSVANIAGLGDASGRVLGLMPHPERFLHATQHPQWTRRGLQGEGAGMRVFRNAVEYFNGPVR